MKHIVLGLGFAAILLVAPASLAQDTPTAVRIELKDSVWRGQAGQQIRVVYRVRGMRRTLEGTLARYSDGWLEMTGAGGKRLSPVFSADILSIEQIGGSPDPSTPVATPGGDTSSDEAAGPDGSGGADTPEDGEVDMSIRPSFFLPLTGGVGGEFRPEEIEAVTAEADELGPGQTIVLEINSGGGYVAEWVMIRDAIYDAQKRHRLVAWVLDGTSAAAMTSLCCDVIVMKSRGHFGSITTLAGGPSLPTAMQVASARTYIEPMLRKSGRSPKLGIPFKTGDAGNLSMLSYTKDPDTGDVTWYQSLEGEVICNDPAQPDDVLGFTSAEAIACGLAIGPADTKEELGMVLDQGGWREVGTGQKLHEKWNDLVLQCNKSITLANRELQNLPNGEEGLRKQIKIFEQWIRWWDRAANACMGQIPPKKQLQQMVIVLKEQLEAIQRAN